MVEKEIVESLNKISSNLVDINNTLKKPNNEKVEEPINYDKMIQDLVSDIDGEKSLFRVRDYFSALSTFILSIISISILVLVPYCSLVTFSDRLIIVLAGLAFIVSYGLFVKDSIEKRFIDINYFRATEKFKVSKDGKPFLKALIKIKAGETEFTLTEICKISPEMFTKEKLLEKLYE